MPHRQKLTAIWWLEVADAGFWPSAALNSLVEGDVPVDVEIRSEVGVALLEP